MKSLRPYSLLIYCLLAMSVIINGCAAHRETVSQFEADSPSEEKIQIRVKLEMTEAYKSTQHEEMFTVFHLGNNLKKYTEILADKMFDVVVKNTGEYNAILVPEVVSTNFQMPMWRGQDSRILIIHKWTLMDKSNNLIWLKTISGTGVLGRVDANELAILALDDLFTKTSGKISSSIEIRNFAKSISSESKAATGSE